MRALICGTLIGVILLVCGCTTIYLEEETPSGGPLEPHVSAVE
jgi:hypothetical protein